ncbi:MAG: class III signal peptide-containing protein [Euryarchaeota archaeon]|nr:class III signal peptide-containing protein [Euryarchaeota archaeon]
MTTPERLLAQVSLEYILILGGVLVVVVIVVWTYHELVKSAARALANTTEAVLNQTLQEVAEWLKKL